jgi:hypothetical protein
MTTNQYFPRQTNSRVVWFFNSYVIIPQKLQCVEGMMPSMVSLEASWGIGESYAFTPEKSPSSFHVEENSNGERYYFVNPYMLNLELKSGLGVRNVGKVTYRAEYACTCPGTYRCLTTDVLR